MRRYRFRRRSILSSRGRTVVFFVSVLTVFISLIILCGRARPIIKELASAKAADLALGRINSAISDSYLSPDSYRGEMSRITYGEDGNVTAISVNENAVNPKRTDIVGRILSAFSEEKLTASIPLGAVTGIDILSQTGPRISVVLDSAPKITADLRQELITAGINQTNHRIILDIRAEVKVILPSCTFSVEVENSVCLAETLIVGKVPDAYTEIHRAGNGISETDIDDIYDFGAAPVE